MNVDLIRSAELTKQTRAQNKDCFRNAFRALVHLPEGQYVEGFATGPELPLVMCHGWAEDANGTIIDPTPTWQKEGVAYFPARKWTLAEATKAVSKDKYLPINPRFRMEMIPEEYWPAYEAATRHAMGSQADQWLAMLKSTARKPCT